MINENKNQSNIKNSLKVDKIEKDSGVSSTKSLPEKGPLSFLSGALTSIIFAFISLSVSNNVVLYFSRHSKVYESQIAQSIANGLKTLIIGTSFLATFTFSFIGIGLTIVFLRSLFNAKEREQD